MAVFNAETAESAAIEVRAALGGRHPEVLSPDALRFLDALHRRFDDQRKRLLKLRESRHIRFANKAQLRFSAETEHIRDGDWTVAARPGELAGPIMALSGPADRKSLLEGLGSGADVYIADLSEATVHGWTAIIDAQLNLLDRWDGRLEVTDAQSGKTWRLDDRTAAVMLRPRGWHLDELNLRIDGVPISASLFDFGLYTFHCAAPAMVAGSAPYFALPSIESSQEARLWDDVLGFAEEQLVLPRGTLRAMPALETLTAVFEIDEVLYEMRDHALGYYLGAANLARSHIATLRADDRHVLPDREFLGQEPDFLTAAAQLMAQTCDRRAAMALGAGVTPALAADGPEETDRPAAAMMGALAARLDGLVVHQRGEIGAAVSDDNVPAATRLAEDMPAGEEAAETDLLRTPQGDLTEGGLRASIRLGITYLEGWLRGRGSVELNSRTFSLADADLARAQIWQQLRHAIRLDDGRVVDPPLVSVLIDDELFAIRNAVGVEAFGRGRYSEAQKLLQTLVFAPDFPPYMTSVVRSISD